MVGEGCLIRWSWSKDLKGVRERAIGEKSILGPGDSKHKGQKQGSFKEQQRRTAWLKTESKGKSEKRQDKGVLGTRSWNVPKIVTRIHLWLWTKRTSSEALLQKTEKVWLVLKGHSECGVTSNCKRIWRV